MPTTSISTHQNSKRRRFDPGQSMTERSNWRTVPNLAVTVYVLEKSNGIAVCPCAKWHRTKSENQSKISALNEPKSATLFDADFCAVVISVTSVFPPFVFIKLRTSCGP